MKTRVLTILSVFLIGPHVTLAQNSKGVMAGKLLLEEPKEIIPAELIVTTGSKDGSFKIEYLKNSKVVSDEMKFNCNLSHPPKEYTYTTYWYNENGFRQYAYDKHETPGYSYGELNVTSREMPIFRFDSSQACYQTQISLLEKLRGGRVSFSLDAEYPVISLIRNAKSGKTRGSR